MAAGKASGQPPESKEVSVEEVAGFTREELEELEERARREAAETDDAGLRAALQMFGEAAGNLAGRLPGGETKDPFATGD